MYSGIEKDVIDEIKAWSEHALEVPNKYFNNLPACPYARSAWKEDKVDFVFKYCAHKQDIYTAVSCFDDTKDLYLDCPSIIGTVTEGKSQFYVQRIYKVCSS